MNKRLSKKLSYVLIFSMIFTSIFTFGIGNIGWCEKSVNLVKNNSFEDWETDPIPKEWDKKDSVSKETTVKHTGEYSVKQQEGGTKSLAQTINSIEAGKEYTIEYWYYDNDKNAKSRPWIYWKDSDNKNIVTNEVEFRPSTYSTDSDLWQKYSVKVTAPDNATKLYFEVRTYKDASGKGVIYYDDFAVLTKVSEEQAKKVLPVIANPKSGAVNEGTMVSLSTNTEGATVMYSVYGKEYDKYEVYDKPIKIDKAMTIKAKAVKDGMENSDVTEFEYTIKPPASLTSIKDAKALGKGNDVIVEGIVTTKPGSFGGKSFYIQDSTCGALVFPSSTTTTIDRGNKVRIVGKTDDFKGKFEVIPSSIEVISTETTEPTAKDIKVSDIAENNEGQLVKANNVEVVKITTDKNNNAYIKINDGVNEGTVKLDSRIGKKFSDLTIKESDLINVKGVIEQNLDNTYIILIRELEDINYIGVAVDEKAPKIEHTAPLAANTNLNLDIKAKVSDNKIVKGVKLYYRTKGTVDYKFLEMDSSAQEYSVTISKEDLAIAGLQYYIEATDGKNVATYPEDKNNPCELVVSNEDTIGPKISSVEPADGKVFDENANVETIKAQFTDDSGIDLNMSNIKNTIKLVIDGVEINDLEGSFYKKGEDYYLEYKIANKLQKGLHTVSIEISDKKGNKSTQTWTFSIGKEILHPYFGQLHSHTEYSDGKGTARDAYEWAKTKGKVDFFAVTDHSNSFDSDLGNENVKDINQSTSNEWKELHQIADSYNKDSEFVAIGGYEMTWSGSTGGWGHINTFNTPWFASRNNNKMDLQAYYNRISTDINSISQLNHPGKTFGDFADFGYYNQAIDNVVYLTEVGNGEGPVRSSGYFPSYDYYTRALDKGWHIAPSNNQDNHKGNWITANDARTVVLAPKLTRDSIYDAIRKSRVYATEDKNLQISYEVNGQPMGTRFTNPKNLDISIKVKDLDESDKIVKVDIISDGGVVVESKNFDSNQIEWNLKLDPIYTYYYVKIVEADKDIAVTAPVWTGDVVSVGVSKLEAMQDIIEKNKSVDIEATVFNNTNEAISKATIEFYKNEVTKANKIGEADVDNLVQGGISKGKVSWTPDKEGNYKIYAVMKVNVDGAEKVSTVSTSLNVINKEDIVKVVIDASHVNQYVSGSYAGKMTEIKNILKNKQMMAVEDKDGLTAEDLKDASILIITSPQPADSSKNNLKKSKLTDEEIKVVTDFVNAGGSLIITSRADYGDGEGDYQNSIQANKLLESIGSNLRVNDDEVVDNNINEGQAFRLMFNKFTSSKYNLTSSDEITNNKYSFYSGCSVMLKAGGDASNVDFLVKGHETTDILDSDKQNDCISIDKGNVYALGAEELKNGGKVVVGGTTFFSDFEMSGDNKNSNIQITDNIIDWMKPKLVVDKKSIADVRIDADNNGEPDNYGKKFMVEGYVTAESSAYTKEKGRDNAFFDVIYVQDETAGITVFGISTKKIPLGSKVRIIGEVQMYQGDSELEIKNENTDLTVLSDNINVIEPTVMKTGESMLEKNEGRLVKVTGKVTKMVTNEDNALYLDDGSGESRIYVEGYIGDENGNKNMLGKWNSSIKIGDTVSAIGLASEDPVGHRLRVRNTSEIVLISSASEKNGSSHKSSSDNKIETPASSDVSKELNKQLEDKNSSKVTIDVKKSDKVEVSVDASLIKGIAEKGKNIEVNNGEVSLEIKPSSIKVEDGAKLKIEANKLGEKETQEILAKKNVYNLKSVSSMFEFDLKSESGNKERKLTFDKPIAITIKYDSTKVSNPKKLGAYYYNENTQAFEYVGGKADKNGNFVFDANHFSKYAVMEYSKSFADVGMPWAKEQIEVLASKQIVKGIDESNYNPNGNITRAEFAKIIVSALNLKPGKQNVSFKDVESGAWYEQYVKIAASLDIVKGDGDKFNPNNKITREEMITMLCRAIKQVDSSKNNSSEESHFVDANNISDWARESVNLAYKNGLIKGTEENKFNPKKNTSRAESAVVIYKTLEMLNLL